MRRLGLLAALALIALLLPLAATAAKTKKSKPDDDEAKTKWKAESFAPRPVGSRSSSMAWTRAPRRRCARCSRRPSSGSEHAAGQGETQPRSMSVRLSRSSW